MRTATSLLFAALLLAGPLVPTMRPQGLINRRAPSFSLPDSTFKQYDLLDYRGKWLLIEFVQTTATTCPTCKDVSVKLEALKKKYGTRLEVLTILVAPPETQQTARQYAADTKLSTPIVFDMGQMAASYFKATPSNNAIDIPHVFAINPQGTIVRDWSRALLSSPGFPGEVDQLVNGAGKGK